MGASKDLFLKMTEREYMDIPENVRQTHLASKIYNESKHDFNELMKDDVYSKLYNQKKVVTRSLQEREYQLRENKQF